MFPAARLADTTVTADPITGPGVPTVLISDMVASVVGDTVRGHACDGAITLGSLTVLIGARPAARITSLVAGANPESGVPVSTTVATGAPTVLIGG